MKSAFDLPVRFFATRAASPVLNRFHPPYSALALTLALSLLALVPAMSQQRPQSSQTPQAQGIRVTGRVVDEQGKPIKSASLFMKHLGDGSVTGDIADSTGRLSLSNAKPGRYYVAVSFIGLAKYKDTINVEQSQQLVDLGTITLRPTSAAMGEVNVSAERESIELTPEKKVFNVEKNATVTGGTAADVLKQVPTVDVDVNGNISVRGSSNLVIQINGKQSGFAGSDRAALLQQIPANLIEKVEVITNPSARYDAEGMAGIINIVTKTAITQSWNLTLTAGAGTNDKYNTSVDAGYKDGPLSLTAGYGVRTNRFLFMGDIHQTDLFGDRNMLDQSVNTMWANTGHFGNFNADYTLTKDITLNLTGQFRMNNGKNDEALGFQYERTNGDLYRLVERNNVTTRGWKSFELGGGYKQVFSAPQHYLDISTRYSSNAQTAMGHYVEQEYNTTTRTPLMSPATTNNNVRNEFVVWTAQADYVQPHSTGKFEVGAKSTLRAIQNDVYMDSLNRATSEYVPNTELINNFKFNELVLAGYGIYATKFADINIQAGLRAEHTIINTLQSVGNVSGGMSYTYLFPSVHLSKKFEGGYEAQLSYSRRINRPNFWQLNPFPMYSNPTLLQKGNPSLMPELVDAVEGTFMTTLDQHTLTATGYLRRTSNSMQFIASVDSTSGVTTLSFQNLSAVQNVGAEFIYRGQIFKWWTATANVNLFYNSVQGGSESANVSAGIVTYNARLMSTFRTPWEGGSLQVTYMYNGPSLLAQGKMQPFQDVTLGYRQDLSKEWAVTFNVSDVFNTRAFNLELVGSNFTGVVHNKPETRIATLNVTYRIGAMQADASRRRRDAGNDAPPEGGIGF
jgi:outer membrane receptor protein involved in Fe transport